MLFEDVTVAFIGAGAMGGAMIGGMLREELVKPYQIVAAEPDEVRGKALVEKFGIRHTVRSIDAVETADVVVLAVKPQILDRVLPELRDHVDTIPLIISIVAGVKIRKIAGELHNSRVVRAMPNTPGQIGQGISVWTATLEVMEKQRQQASALLGALGEQLHVSDEKYLDMATALAGSGPGYVFMIMEAMIDTGVHMGFSRSDARKLVLQTVKGSAQYAQLSDEHTAVLRNQVTSPAGTTAAGLAELENHGIRAAISSAIWAAYHRSVELGEEDD